MEDVDRLVEVLEDAGIKHDVKPGLYGDTVYVKDDDGRGRAKVSMLDPNVAEETGRTMFVEGRATVDEVIAMFVPETCRFEVTSNVVQNGVSWDCMGIVCDRCGYAQMSFTPPKVCPRCKRRVVL